MKFSSFVKAGEVYTWGCNKEGQLGYGTSNSVSNYIPRVVKYLIGVAAAKYHTIVLGSDGEVFTWGHHLVTPRRVVIAINIRKIGNTTLKLYCKERLNVVAVATGMTHSMALTDDGALFFWVSSDPDLRCRQKWQAEIGLVHLSVYLGVAVVGGGSRGQGT
ncbi:ankyrin repeat family protein/regulator of chromosome condensation (RCC1) family protein [Forsythia ovata]|uniref:Ankyrin repeat family protein/regulator of chromosome condensation (RCC1) family protein n=1 Tax=Forsythia ovata TaxID=205694 RepID=A0ABD1PFB7_9LAMI